MFASIQNKLDLLKPEIFIDDAPLLNIDQEKRFLFGKGNSIVLDAILLKNKNSYSIFDTLNVQCIRRKVFLSSNKRAAKHFTNTLFNEGNKVLITPYHNLSLTHKVIQTLEEFSLYWDRYSKVNKSITLEIYQQGDPFSILIKDGKLLGLYSIVPAYVIGDGKSKLKDLIRVLKDRRSNNILYSKYKLEKIDPTLNLEEIPISGEIVKLKSSRQIKYGAQYIDITNYVKGEYNSLIKDINGIIGGKYLLILNCFSSNILAGSRHKTFFVDEIRQASDIYECFLRDIDFDSLFIPSKNKELVFFKKAQYYKAKPYSNKHFTSVTQLDILKEAAYQLGLKNKKLSARCLLVEDSIQNNKCIFIGGISQFTTTEARKLTNNKHLTKEILSEHGIRVPKGKLFKISEYDKASQYISDLTGSAFIVKPLNLMGGRGVSTDIFDHNQLLMAWQRCEQLKCLNIIVEEQIPGDDYRVLVVKNKVYAVARRIAPYVIGNGRDNIKKLVELKNIKRRENKYLRNSPIVISSYVEQYLSQQKLELTTVPEKGKRVNLSKVSNAGSGGEIIDCSDNVHEDWIPIAVKIRELMANAYHVGIDFLMEDISKSPRDQKWGVIEVNTNPDFAVHLFPSEGEPRNVGKPFLEEIFSPSPQNKFVYRLKILGKVQEVGYRSWFKRICEFRSVCGYIKNASSKDVVDALIVGYKNNIDEIVELSYTGPKNADVSQVIVDELTDNIEEYRSLQSFEIKVTD